MHEMSHVVNKLNGFSDFASFGTFYGLLIQSWDVYCKYDLQIMHFTAASWNIYSEYDLQIIHFTTESWDVYSKYDLKIMHFTAVILS